MKGWTIKEIENLARNSNIAGFKENGALVEPPPIDRHTNASIPFEHKPSKYRNVKTMVDGIEFDSKKEAARYQELKIMEKAGIISELKLQVVHDLSVNAVHVCKYIADFTYIRDNRRVTEDVKGMKTIIYKMKKKLMKAIYNIEIQEI